MEIVGNYHIILLAPIWHVYMFQPIAGLTHQSATVYF